MKGKKQYSFNKVNVIGVPKGIFNKIRKGELRPGKREWNRKKTIEKIKVNITWDTGEVTKESLNSICSSYEIDKLFWNELSFEIRPHNEKIKKTKKYKNGIIYLRTSSYKNENEKYKNTENSLKKQLENCLKIAAKKNIMIVNVLEHNGVSGNGNMKRRRC